MRWVLLIIFLGCLGLSVSLRPPNVSIPAAATIEPWVAEDAAMYDLDYGRAQGNERASRYAAGAANNATLRAALNLIGWGCFAFFALITLRTARRRQERP